jgi:branched-chain amino acid transport system ATP-binding protein
MRRTSVPEDLALELRAVDAGYGATMVIHNVSIEVPRSSVVALLGPNGVGKTTTLRVAAGLLRSASGSVLVGGTEVSRTS